MKFRFSKEQGSVLVMTLATAGVIGITLASYLKMCEAQSLAVARSQNWNSAMPYCEAGIEEALTHLNSVGDGSRATNGWTLVSSKYQMSRTLGDSYFVATITTNTPPIVVSTGYVKIPLTTNIFYRVVQVGTTKQGTGFKGLVAKGSVDLVGNITMDSFNSTDPTYSTGGKYDPAKRHDDGFVGSVEGSILGGGGLVHGNAGTGPSGTASGTVGDSNWVATSSGIQDGHYSSDLNMSFPDVAVPFSGGAFTPSGGTAVITNVSSSSSSVTTNSYPSGFTGPVVTNTGSYTSATYPSPSPAGPVTTNTVSTTESSLPASGTYLNAIVTNVTTSGMGSMAATVTNYTYDKITGYTYSTTSYTYGTSITNLTYTTNTYAYVLDSYNYQISSISISGSEGPGTTLLVRGNAVLYVENSIKLAGGAQILVLPGASLKLYVGTTADLTGNGVMNTAENALSFQLFGLPTCTDIKIAGNGAFTGTIYAPAAYLHGAGGGSDSMDIVGAAIVGSAKLNGHFSFHYDEMLANQGGGVSWKINSWEEL